jgi:chemotaxis protein MotB
LLQQDGVRVNQVTQVRGYADQMLRVKNNPTDPSNRRVSILVKNDNQPVPILYADKIVNGSTPLPKGGANDAAKTSPSREPAQSAKGAETGPGSARSREPQTADSKPKAGLLARVKGLLPGSKK